MTDLDAIAGQEEFNMTTSVARYRDISTDNAMARRMTVEAIDEAMRDLAEARLYVVNARELARVA